MSRIKRPNGQHWWLIGTALALTVFLTTCWSRGADLVVDGGDTYAVSNDVTFNNIYVGNLSTGNLNQSGFTNTLTGNLYLGYSAGSSGAYNLSGGSLSASNEVIGLTGSGVFTQSNGDNTMIGNLQLGYDPGGSGTYNLSGGSLSTGVEFIGFSGQGVFNQSGGTASVNSYTYLGFSPGSSGVYNLSGGSLSQVRQYVGLYGSGIFNQTGGSNTVQLIDIYSGLYLGYWGDARGAYNLSNGSLTAPFEIVGVFGTGVFNQSNGVNKINGDLSLGDGRNSSGTYNLSGGDLSVENEVIGASGNGTFIQTGGTHTITGDLVLAASPGSRGTLALLGGGISVGGNYIQTAAGTLAVGLSSSANFPKIEVGGTASLNGAFIPVLQGGYLPLGNQLFHGVISAAQGISGTFGTMGNQFITPTLYWQPLYTPNTFDLLVLRSYTNPALTLTRNQSNVGAILNSVATSAAGDLNTALNAIDGLSSSSLVANAFQQISPDKATALPALALAGANLQMRNLSRRVTNLRFGGSEMDSA
ncbi:MAG: hypothetical protein NTY36_16320 [Deltaproteobacteria bacterium]|nr:hypothetical protein [Deltaproteobacteria bacterium]